MKQCAICFNDADFEIVIIRNGAISKNHICTEHLKNYENKKGQLYVQSEPIKEHDDLINDPIMETDFLMEGEQDDDDCSIQNECNNESEKQITSIEYLNKQMKEAIKNEDFALAARLRDEIKNMEINK
jgi:excinuclease UvrABC helicase subunit UvrB